MPEGEVKVLTENDIEQGVKSTESKGAVESEADSSSNEDSPKIDNSGEISAQLEELAKEKTADIDIGLDAATEAEVVSEHKGDSRSESVEPKDQTPEEIEGSQADSAEKFTTKLVEWLQNQSIIPEQKQQGSRAEYLDLARAPKLKTASEVRPTVSRSKQRPLPSPGVVMATNLVRKPDLFSGEEPELWHEWLERFEVIANANGWDEARKLLIMPSYLTQHAFQLYGEIPKADITDFRALTRLLATRLRTGDKQMLWSLQLRGAKKKNGETQAAFLFRLRKLVARAHPNQGVAHTNQVMKEQFIMGQPADLQFYLLRLPDKTTLMEVIEHAKNYEAAQEIVQGTKTVNMVETGFHLGEASTGIVGTPDNKGGFIQPVTTMVGQEVAAIQQGGNSPICYKCDQTGHISRVCGQEKPRDMQQVTCFKCQQRGHMARNCPNNKPTGTISAPGKMVCYRCNNKGHQAKVCRTDISLQCTKCGKKGHTFQTCKVQMALPAGQQPMTLNAQSKNEKGGICMTCGVRPAYMECDCGGYYCSPVCKGMDKERHQAMCSAYTKNESSSMPTGAAWAAGL